MESAMSRRRYGSRDHAGSAGRPARIRRRRIPEQRLATLYVALLVAIVSAACASAPGNGERGDAAARQAMVREQIAARGIRDARVLDAMTKVERHRFVRPSDRPYAYGDFPLHLEAGQTISQPYIVALMTELLGLKGKEKVLEIGTGSGYQAAILAELADSVFTIEIVESLAQSAQRLLGELGYANVIVRCGDGFQGWAEHAPFDGIIVTCAPPEIPPPLLEQLAEGGRLVLPVGDAWQELIVVERQQGRFDQRNVLPVRFVPMTGDGVKRGR